MVYLSVLTAMWGCRKPYTPAAIIAPNNYLVVEGVINNGGDSTLITLSKTVNISQDTTANPVSGATVQVQAEDGSSYDLTERTPAHPGQYLKLAINLDNTKKYRLHISSADGEYVSDYVPVKQNPPIDAITYKATDKGLQINSNTHDATNSTRYYRWAYEEAWRYHSEINSGLIVKNGVITFRAPNEMYYYCYAGDKSSHIVLASSEKLSEDVISENPVTLVPPTSEKLQVKYSILLKQYALTKEAYAFWENIKKNTEQLGSIFDAQPSQLKGNIHSVTNPNEPVIGYMSITNVQTKRIFIPASAFPDTYNVPLTSCENKPYLLFNPASGQDDVEYYIIQSGLIPTQSIANSAGMLIGYKASTVECTDCRVRGILQAPDFWEF